MSYNRYLKNFYVISAVICCFIIYLLAKKMIIGIKREQCIVMMNDFFAKEQNINNYNISKIFARKKQTIKNDLMKFIKSKHINDFLINGLFKQVEIDINQSSIYCVVLNYNTNEKLCVGFYIDDFKNEVGIGKLKLGTSYKLICGELNKNGKQYVGTFQDNSILRGIKKKMDSIIVGKIDYNVENNNMNVKDFNEIVTGKEKSSYFKNIVKDWKFLLHDNDVENYVDAVKIKLRKMVEENWKYNVAEFCEKENVNLDKNDCEKIQNLVDKRWYVINRDIYTLLRDEYCIDFFRNAIGKDFVFHVKKQKVGADNMNLYALARYEGCKTMLGVKYSTTGDIAIGEFNLNYDIILGDIVQNDGDRYIICSKRDDSFYGIKSKDYLGGEIIIGNFDKDFKVIDKDVLKFKRFSFFRSYLEENESIVKILDNLHLLLCEY